MNRHLHSPTRLTEFARDFDEEQESIFNKFVTKLQNAYNAGYNTVNEVPTAQGSGASIPASSSQTSLKNAAADTNSITSTSSISTLGSTKPPIERSSTSEDPTEPSEKSDEIEPQPNEGRTMVNVIKNISNLLASKNSNLRSYKDTELQKLWMPDSKAKECYDCAQKFSTFRRKHHCRLCGQIFCSKCCNQEVPGRIIMCSGALKVCNYCSKIVLSYLKSPDITIDLNSDLQALQEDLSSKLSQNTENNDNLTATRKSALQRKVSVGYQEERFVFNKPEGLSLSNVDRKSILQQSNSLKALYEEMVRLLPFQNCGMDLIEYLNVNHKSSNKIQAMAILNAMLEAGFLVAIVQDSLQIGFDENLHYKFANKDELQSTQISECSEDDLTSSHYSEVHNRSDIDPPKSLDANNSFQSMKNLDLENTTTTSLLVKSFCDHEDLLLSQLLRNANLDQAWADVLIPMCVSAANQFQPEYCNNDLMDIRHYVNVKKVPGGSRKDCTLFRGVVFTKNVVHKEMATRVDRPRILLLQCPIVYERVEGKFVSIKNVMLQEKEYLRNVTARILSLKPNVVLVHKNVAGIAQDMLRSQGITLVLDVKISVMERLAKCLQCGILSSIESNIGKPKLGVCDSFYIQSFDDGNGGNKTLMFFEKNSNPRGYCCLIRGGTNAELARVKKVASFLIFARYNWKLEMSFLLDEFAQPVAPKPIPAFDSKEPSPCDDNEQELVSRNTETPEFGHRKLTERKSEDKIRTTENVSDFTDPLRAAELSPTKFSADTTVVELAVETPFDNRFRNALNSTVLSVSPFLSFSLPYLESEQGRKCALRSLFPNELYFSKQWSTSNEKSTAPELTTEPEESVALNPVHPFLKYKIHTSLDNHELQTLLAEFRAFGGRYPKTNKMLKFFKPKPAYQKPQKVNEDHIYSDALDLENHQRLPVLFCSFYNNQKAGTSFCAPPTLLNMKFYGQYDIMLGEFLQRYCFPSYICPLCKLPMMDHVRRFVHSMGCVQVSLHEDTSKFDTDDIFLTSWCSVCREVTARVALSETSKSLSFAKYLELRFHGHAYRKRVEDGADSEGQCQHSLHRDYINYFSYKGIGARFTYTPIEVWEIGMPPLILTLEKPKPFDNSKVLEDIKDFSMKGHEVYSKIHEKIADFATEDESAMLNNLKAILNGDQFIFRQQVEIVQTLLTEETASSYDLSDAMVMLKRALAENIETWGPRLLDAEQQMKALQKQDSSSYIDAGTVCTEDLKSDPESPSATPDPKTPPFEANMEYEANTPASSKSNKGNQDQTTDKNSIKRILSQLLPSTNQGNVLPSPLSQNEHLTLPLGAFPVVINDKDLSSIISYSLISNDYKKAIESINTASNATNSTMNTPSPNLNRKSQEQPESGEKEAEDEKKSKSDSFIELAFTDSTTQFTCKIYYAKEFDAMRANVLKTPKIERNLYRELEMSKKREELKVSQKSSLHEMEIVRRASSEGVASTSNLDSSEETRIFLARSLRRSIPWDAKGGKSGSKFNKTFDERFILKEMSKNDLNIFENFAPNYFEYINKCLQQNTPTLLAKIFGVFKVTIKKKDSVQEKSVLVMENLFYNYDIQNKFDLKGSERNRMVNPLDQKGETVWLDENLIEMSWSKPLYILSHSKTVIKEAVIRDATFLEKNKVMDYSLLVGQNNDDLLVIGIIDYIRTFTLEKKLESYIKQSGILGGSGKLPTVVPPTTYKQRFIDAMDRYFNCVPDRWEGLSKK